MTFPRKVSLYEVGPRDGLQNEKEIILNEISKLEENDIYRDIVTEVKKFDKFKKYFGFFCDSK